MIIPWEILSDPLSSDSQRVEFIWNNLAIFKKSRASYPEILHCDFLRDLSTCFGLGPVISGLGGWNLGLLFQGQMDGTKNVDLGCFS